MPQCDRDRGLRIFQTFGTQFVSVSGDQAQAEACPWCGKDRFYVNGATGQYNCFHCGEKGNPKTYIRWVYSRSLEQTTNDDYLALKAAREGIASQTLKTYGLAYDRAGAQWLVPFLNQDGHVINLQLYRPDQPKPNKLNLAGLPTALFGFPDLVSGDKKRLVFLHEGPWDALATAYNLGANNRKKYCIVAVPGSGFKEDWVKYFDGRKVRVLFDNDEGGRQQAERLQKMLADNGKVAELQVLKWPEQTPDGYDIANLIRDQPEIKIVGFTESHCYKITRVPKLVLFHGRRDPSQDKPTDWVWPNHLPCGTYISFSGYQGTFKSTIMLWVTASYTIGRPMPTMKGGKLAWEEVGLPPGHVLYIFAEDDRKRVEESFERAGGDFDKWHAMPATIKDGSMMNILEHLPEIEETVRKYDIRLVVIDGQNSVVGAPCIATDILARHHITNPLHQFAQRLNVCLVGLRNEDPLGRAYGPASMRDLGRCVIRTQEPEPKTNPPYCVLNFEKVSHTSRANYLSIPYSVEDTGGSAPLILWGKERPADERVDQQGAQQTEAAKPTSDAAPGAGGTTSQRAAGPKPRTKAEEQAIKRQRKQQADRIAKELREGRASLNGRHHDAGSEVGGNCI